MYRYIAFLRAINVGGHNVRMIELCNLFTHAGYSNVASFIASGNIIFDSNEPNTNELETQIQNMLQVSLGYNVATFIRTPIELEYITNYKPFAEPIIAESNALNIAFLHIILDESARIKLESLKTDIDDFHIHQREIYWSCKKKQSESTISNAVFEKTLRMQSALRGLNTIRKLAELTQNS